MNFMTKTHEMKPQSTRICKICKESKPEDQFVISTVGYMKKFSDICAKCRETDFDDEGGGGKRGTFDVDQDTKYAMLLEQEKDKKAREEEKKEAREEFAEEILEKEEEKDTQEIEKIDESAEKKKSSEEKIKSREKQSEYTSGVDAIFDKNWELVHQIFTGGLAAYSHSWVSMLLGWVAHTGGASAFTINWREISGKVHSGRIQSTFLNTKDQSQQKIASKNEPNELFQFVKESFAKYPGK